MDSNHVIKSNVITFNPSTKQPIDQHIPSYNYTSLPSPLKFTFAFTEPLLWAVATTLTVQSLPHYVQMLFVRKVQ
jgi:hypothetical protein